MHQTDDLRIARIEELLPPVALLERYPVSERAAETAHHRWLERPAQRPAP